MTGGDCPDRGSLEEEQLRQLRGMLAELAEANRFYQRKWEEAGVTGLPYSLAGFAAGYPFTRKIELVDDQRSAPPYGTNLTYPLPRYTRFSQTSGTTGTPLRWLDTPESWSWMVDNWVEVFQIAGATAEDRIFFAFSFGPFLGFWTAYEAGLRIGALCLPGGGMSTPGRLRAILDNEATVLCCTPTYAIHLGEVAAAEGLDLARSGIRNIIVAGEPGAGIPETRAYIERLWPGARLWDHHGMTETGPVTFECPARRAVLHVIERSYVAEVIDPDSGAPAAPGEIGELVLTNLGRTGSPLVRYRTGDLVRPTIGTCACGRADLALEGGIIGRTDDMVVIRGVNVYPTALEAIVRRFDRVAEYRVEIHDRQALPELRVLLEPAPECGDATALGREVEAALRSAFNLRTPVAIVEPGTLPRFELKAKRWVRVQP